MTNMKNNKIQNANLCSKVLLTLLFYGGIIIEYTTKNIQEMLNMERTGAWQGKKVLFIGDSLTARRVYSEGAKRNAIPVCDLFIKFPKGYRRIGEVIAGAIISAYGN